MRGLADLEIGGIKKSKLVCHTIHYGPIHEETSIIDKTAVFCENAIRINNALRNEDIRPLFLNTAFDRHTIIRDFITLSILKPFKSKIFLKFHGSDLHFLESLNWWEKKLVNMAIQKCSWYRSLIKRRRSRFYKKGIS